MVWLMTAFVVTLLKSDVELKDLNVDDEAGVRPLLFAHLMSFCLSAHEIDIIHSVREKFLAFPLMYLSTSGSTQAQKTGLIQLRGTLPKKRQNFGTVFYSDFSGNRLLHHSRERELKKPSLM